MAAIVCEQVACDYILKTGSDSLKRCVVQGLSFLRGGRQSTDEPLRYSHYRALDQLTLSLSSGDRLGLLGLNGAGKSTLLRVMGQVYYPTEGHVRVEGKTSHLFAVGLGMNEEATGIENIEHMALFQGARWDEIQEKMAEIKAFTELGDFLHQPVRTYSAGMKMRLSFAVATHFINEVLLVDEVIGVGDAAFMSKAQARLQCVMERSALLVLASHDNEVIQRFCNKVLVLHRGKNIFLGPVDQGLAFYEQHVREQVGGCDSV